ncbi:MAG: putative Ig domain-containing protein [Pirellulales bacterium]
MNRFAFERLEDRKLLAVTGLGGDLLVNTFTAGPQSTAEGGTAIALSGSGDGVVVFEGRGAGDRDGVFARRISAAGVPLGADFRINETTQERQGDASIAMRGDGSFVVVWAGRGRGDQDGVFLRLYAANGTPLTGEILVNQTTAGKQGKPAVEIAPDGSIVVAWEGSGGGDFAGVFVRRFTASGAAIGPETLANDPSPLRQSDPTIAVQVDGSFLVAWTNRGVDGSGYDIVARRFDAAGRPASPQFAVNSNRAGDQVAPDVAPLANGAYDVVWSSIGANDVGWDVKQTRASAAGQTGAEQRVHVSAQGDQRQPKIAAAADGSTIVAWTSAAPNGAGREVVAREFAASSAAVQAEFAVPAAAQGFASGHQHSPSLAIGPQGAAIAWTGHGRQDRHGVYVRGFDVDGVAANRPPDLAPIPNQTVVAGTELTLTATATDPDGDRLTFSLDPESAALLPGATINPQTGVFTWTPPATQMPGPVTVRILVTDDGEPPLADSETFIITVTAPAQNQAPNLLPIADRSVAEGSEMRFTALATDPDQNQLTFAIDPETALPGATIDPMTGEFRWTPTEDQGPGEFDVRILVIDNGTPALADSETFKITVTEVNRAPALTKPMDVVVQQGAQLGFTASATDLDVPANLLRFSIDPDSVQLGMTLDAVTGQFLWAVPATQQPGDYEIRLLVVDDADPALADSEVFRVTVE